MAILSIVFGIIGFEYMDEMELASISENQPNQAPTGKVSLVVKLESRVLEVYNDDQLYKKYRIAVGKSKTPTPIGEWNVVWKDYNWGTGFGTRWMGLNVPWGTYGIHGTNKPWSIGQFASHGCIRMRNKDVEELFEWVPIGTAVRIEGRKIKVDRNLKYKTSGSDVVALQLKLKELGYFQGRADGLFGTMTEDAVRAYQTDKGLPVTGIATKEFCASLGL
ncbi:L,D-transpeptidase family protein [Sporomusa carbonis]|uniref:L,D-transpeptidase family protein n=1 Tax=Sporomusa carbonis TaxID=3076075 RepID=UPI003C7D9101